MQTAAGLQAAGYQGNPPGPVDEATWFPVPPAMADALWQREYASLPGVTLIRVDDSRHFIMADQPERFSEIVDRFLAE